MFTYLSSRVSFHAVFCSHVGVHKSHSHDACLHTLEFGSRFFDVCVCVHILDLISIISRRVVDIIDFRGIVPRRVLHMWGFKSVILRRVFHMLDFRCVILQCVFDILDFICSFCDVCLPC